jgi:hypothetical protein
VGERHTGGTRPLLSRSPTAHRRGRTRPGLLLRVGDPPERQSAVESSPADEGCRPPCPDPALATAARPTVTPGFTQTRPSDEPKAGRRGLLLWLNQVAKQQPASRGRVGDDAGVRGAERFPSPAVQDDLVGRGSCIPATGLWVYLCGR